MTAVRVTAPPMRADAGDYEPRTCELCGESYFPRSTVQRYCSDRCHAKARRVPSSGPTGTRAGIDRTPATVPVYTCLACGDETVTRPERGARCQRCNTRTVALAAPLRVR